MTSVTDFYAALDNRSLKIGVVGLGYVGLPLIDAFQRSGFACLGFDIDSKKIAALNAGTSYIGHIPDERVQQWRQSHRFRATCDVSELSQADVVLICVPTPLNDSRDPDLTYVINTTQDIAKALRPGQLVVLESTTYPGTCREVLLPILQSSNLTAGEDFFLAYSPEREDPGNQHFTARDIPKVVGGLDNTSRDLAVAVYQAAVAAVVPVESLEIAEACKILENTYRSVNIAMVNELKVLFDRLKIDIWQVIDAAKTKPFGFQAFYPGPGLGGHCIPIDPFYLSWLARRHEGSTRFIELAGEINTSMPGYVVDRVTEALNDQHKPVRGSRIGILGVAYKKDVDDPRESPSFKLMELLEQRGAILSYVDPFIPQLPRMRSFDVPELSTEQLTPNYLESLDCTLIATDHTVFDYAMIVQHSALVVDTRNATRDIVKNRERIYKA